MSFRLYSPNTVHKMFIWVYYKTVFLASVYQYTALVCSLFCSLCIEQYQRRCPHHESVCVFVSSLQERREMLAIAVFIYND